MDSNVIRELNEKDGKQKLETIRQKAKVAVRNQQHNCLKKQLISQFYQRNSLTGQLHFYNCFTMNGGYLFRDII